jgi:hypothetical protein
MGQKSRYQIGMKQREKRKKARKKMAAKGQNIDQYYYGKFCLKAGEAG